jgi:hypothetical protein
VLGRLLQLLQCGVALIAGSDQLLTRLTEPLLSKGVAGRSRRLQLMLALDKAVAVEFQVAQQFGLLVGCRQEIEPAADLRRRESGAHLFDFLGELGAVGVARLVILQLGDGRRHLCHLFVVGADLGVELRLALLVVRFLQLEIPVHHRVGAHRRVIGAIGKLGLATPDLCVEAGDLHVQGPDIGGGECRIERRQDVADADPLPFADLNRLD